MIIRNAIIKEYGPGDFIKDEAVLSAYSAADFAYWFKDKQQYTDYRMSLIYMHGIRADARIDMRKLIEEVWEYI
jgi:hypothetical protein